MSNPASVTTNDGTPTFATNVPCAAPIIADDGECDEDAEPAGVVTTVGELELGRSQRGNAAQEPDRQIDLRDQQHEDDTERDHRHACHLEDDVHEVRRREEVRSGEAEEGDDQHLADDDRQNAQVSRLEVVDRALPEPGALLGVPLGQPDTRRDDLGVGAHETISGAVSAIPATFVGIPAVIACTTSCCVVFSRS